MPFILDWLAPEIAIGEDRDETKGKEVSRSVHKIGAGKPGETAQEIASTCLVEDCLICHNASCSLYSMTWGSGLSRRYTGMSPANVCVC